MADELVTTVVVKCKQMCDVAGNSYHFWEMPRGTWIFFFEITVINDHVNNMITSIGNSSNNNTNTNGSNNNNTGRGRAGMFFSSSFLFILLTKIYIDYAYRQQQQQLTITTTMTDRWQRRWPMTTATPPFLCPPCPCPLPCLKCENEGLLPLFLLPPHVATTKTSPNNGYLSFWP